MTSTKIASAYQTGLTMAIFPNAMGFGYAVMKNAMSVEAEGIVREKKRPISNAQVLAKIREKMAYYQPDTIVVEKIEGSQKSKRIARLIEDIIDHAEQQMLEVFRFSREDIRFVFSNFSTYTKFEIAQKIMENIPKMRCKKILKRTPYESEHVNMAIFDAIARGVTYFYVEG